MQFMESFIGTPYGLLAAFVFMAAVVVWAGILLSRYGDVLSKRTGLGNGLIGLVFLAGVTSLPELVVSLASVLNSEEPAHGADLAIGNMLGSNVFNLLILAFTALAFSRQFKLREMGNTHTASALYGLLMLALFSSSYLIAGMKPDWLVPGLQCAWTILMLPLAYTWILIHEHRQNQPPEAPHLPAKAKFTRNPAVRFYSILLFLSGLIVCSGISLSILGSKMARPMEQGGFGLEASLIGTIFLAISTSLPELVISFASVRMGFLEMALGNMFGSNIFNLLIVFAADVAMRHENLLAHASPRHWASVALILLLTLLAHILIRARSRRIAQVTALFMVGLFLVVTVFFM